MGREPGRPPAATGHRDRRRVDDRDRRRRDLPGLVPAEHAPLGFAIVLLLLAAALQMTNALLLSRVRPFAWKRFFQVGRWALLAYAVIAGVIEFAFVYDHTRGAPLVVMTLMLVLFMLNVPVLIAFTVARYEAP